MIRKKISPTADKLRIIFELPASLWADRIFLVGDFNGWDATATQFHQERDGVWRVGVDLPIGRRYEFRYLIDDRWCTDTHADDCCPNDQNSYNSVLYTDPPPRRPDPALGAGMIHATLPVPPQRKVWQDEPPRTGEAGVNPQPDEARRKDRERSTVAHHRHQSSQR